MVSKKTKFLVLVLLLTVLLFGLANGHARAAGGTLSVEPASGPAGTVFTFTASGFSPNKTLNVFAVEPDGIASQGCYNYIAPCDIKTNSSGVASFTWQSDKSAFRSQALGKYTWVVRELFLAGEHVDGQADVRITPGGEEIVSGAALSITPSRGREFTASGSGFAPLEAVNLWLTLPVNCSSDIFAYPSGAIEFGTAKASSSGTIGVELNFTEWKFFTVGLPGFPPFTWYITSLADCSGTYSLTARALGSGSGATVSFEVTGNALPNTDAQLQVTVLNSDATGGADPLHPVIGVVGTGYAPNEGINCWSTRPDGRVYEEPAWTANPIPGVYGGDGMRLTMKADGGGTFNSAWQIGWSQRDFSNTWGFDPKISTEEPGLWYLTCRGASSDRYGVASFWIGPIPQEGSGKVKESGTPGGGGGGPEPPPGPKPPPPPKAPIGASPLDP